MQHLALRHRIYIFTCFAGLAIHRTATVDNLTADIRREIARQEERHVGHILGRTATTQRDLLIPRIAYLLRKLIGHLGDDEAWGDAVSTNATRTHLLSDRLSQANHTSL